MDFYNYLKKTHVYFPISKQNPLQSVIGVFLSSRILFFKITIVVFSREDDKKCIRKKLRELNENKSLFPTKGRGRRQ